MPTLTIKNTIKLHCQTTNQMSKSDEKKEQNYQFQDKTHRQSYYFHIDDICEKPSHMSPLPLAPAPALVD